MAKILIIVAIGAIFLSTAIIGGSPYKEAPWDDMGSWTSNTSNNPQFELIYDDELQTDVMRLYGNYIDYHFIHTNEGKPLVTDKRYMRILSLDLKSEKGGRFQIFVNLKTTRGDTMLWYEAASVNYGRYYYDCIRPAMDPKIRDGRWHTIYMDIRKDFKTVFPMDEILEVSSIKFNGDLYISNVRFWPNLPIGAKLSKPEILVYSYENMYDENTKKVVWQRCDWFDERGVLNRYTITYFSYHGNGRIKEMRYDDYNPDNSIRSIDILRYSKDGDKVKSWAFDGERKLKSCAITQYGAESMLDAIIIYFNKSGEVYLVFERENDGYRGWKTGTRWFNYYKFLLNKDQDGLTVKERFENVDLEDPGYNYYIFKENLFKDFEIYTLRKIYEEFNHDEGAINSIHTAYDASGRRISVSTRYHDPELSGFWGDWGVWFEDEYFNEQGKITKITRGRNFYGARLVGGLYSGLECDYVNNRLEEIRLIYYMYDEENNLKNRWTLYYDNEARLVKIKGDEFDSWNLRSGWLIKNALELQDERIIKTEIIYPDNLVIDGDMKFINGLKPIWKTMGKPICKKISEGMRIEMPHEEGKVEPGYAVQVIPINGGEHELVVDYIRKAGEAHINLDWISIEDLYTINKLEGLATNIYEYVDDSSLGTQRKKIIFTTPGEPGLLILKLGAASVVIYSNVELKPYKPEPSKPIIGPDFPPKVPEPVVDPINQPEPSPVIHPILPPEPEKSSEETKKDLGLGDNDKRVPVEGGYIIFVYNDEENKVKDIDSNIVSDIDLPPPEEICHVRTYRGDMIKKALEEEGIPVEEIQERGKDYSAEFVIASEDGSSQTDKLNYGWRVKGPGIDSIYNISCGEKIYTISKQKVEEATIAPKSPLAHKKPEIKGFRYYTQGIINLIKGKLKEFLLF